MIECICQLLHRINAIFVFSYITMLFSDIFVIIYRAVLISLFIVMNEDKMFDIDMLGDPLLNIVFYVVCEILVAASVLGILHRLPPKRQPRGSTPSQRMYESVPDRPAGPQVCRKHYHNVCMPSVYQRMARTQASILIDSCIVVKIYMYSHL